jgi:multimeric flavodoxin WrbA
MVRFLAGHTGKGAAMKVFALNSSPHRDKGGTGFILAPFLEGMRETGAEVELAHLHGLDIKSCLGCYTCWTKTPGRCAQRDAMDSLLPKFAVDLVVLATPLYVDGMNGTMKLFVDRLIPLIQPVVELRDGHCRHPRRDEGGSGRLVLVSVCGFTELENFDPLVAHVKAICRNMDREYAGALLRPYAATLPSLRKSGLPVDDVLAACRKAGRDLAETGEMDPATIAAVSRELITRDRYVAGLNSFFLGRIEKAKQAWPRRAQPSAAGTGPSLPPALG